MRKNVTINNYYITQRPQNNRPQQRKEPEEKDKIGYGWAVPKNDPFFG